MLEDCSKQAQLRNGIPARLNLREAYNEGMSERMRHAVHVVQNLED